MDVPVPHMDEEQAERAIDGKKRKKDGDDDVEENDDADKPCSSKKKRIGKWWEEKWTSGFYAFDWSMIIGFVGIGYATFDTY